MNTSSGIVGFESVANVKSSSAVPVFASKVYNEMSIAILAYTAFCE